MQLDFVKYKKHHITVSGEGTETVPTLQDIHVVKTATDRHVTYDSLWGAVDGSFAWIKFNFYELSLVERLTFDYSGSFTDITIEKSIDNINWETLSPAWTPTETYLDIDYSNNPEYFIFIRMIINDPSNFILNDLEIFCEVEIDIDYILSHNYLALYGEKERNNYPLFPELNKVTYQMMEGYNNINKKLFDPIIFATSGITPSINGNIVTLTPNNIPLITDNIYIWDFDEVITEGDGDYDVTNQNLVVTTTNTSLAQTYTYKKNGLHIPRLMIKNPDWTIEFTESFTRS